MKSQFRRFAFLGSIFTLTVIFSLLAVSLLNTGKLVESSGTVFQLSGRTYYR